MVVGAVNILRRTIKGQQQNSQYQQLIESFVQPTRWHWHISVASNFLWWAVPLSFQLGFPEQCSIMTEAVCETSRKLFVENLHTTPIQENWRVLGLRSGGIVVRKIQDTSQKELDSECLSIYDCWAFEELWEGSQIVGIFVGDEDPGMVWKWRESECPSLIM